MYDDSLEKVSASQYRFFAEADGTRISIIANEFWIIVQQADAAIISKQTGTRNSYIRI